MIISPNKEQKNWITPLLALLVTLIVLLQIRGC